MAGIWRSGQTVVPSSTWANIATATGNFDGEVRRLPALDGLGGWVFVVWNATTAKWDPEGIQVLASYDLVTGSTGTTSTLTIPTVSFTGGPQWAKTKLEIYLKLSSTVNGATAAPVNMSLGSMSLIADTQATMRRKSFQRIVDITSASVQFSHAKVDNNYSGYTNENAAPLTGTVNTASNFSLTADVSTGWTNASSITLTMQEYVILWRR